MFKISSLFFPGISITGLDNPVIQLIDEVNNKIIYTIRINGTSYQPKVLKEGSYTLKVGDPDLEKEKIISHLSPSAISSDSITIEF